MELNFFCCSFCYKNVDEGELEKEEVDEVLAKFVKLARRYFGGKEMEHLVKLESCPQCFKVVTSFCDLYHQLKCIELEMEWRVSKLKEVMSSADKVEFRKDNFRRSWRKREEAGREAVEEFRKDFITKCSSPVSNSFPKVVLTKRRKKINREELEQCLDDPQSILPLLGGGPSPGKGMIMELVLVPNVQDSRSAAPPPPPLSIHSAVDDNYEEMSVDQDQPPSEDESELRISNVCGSVDLEKVYKPEQLEVSPPPNKSSTEPQLEIISVKVSPHLPEDASLEDVPPPGEVSSQLPSTSMPINLSSKATEPPVPPVESFEKVPLPSSLISSPKRSLRPRKLALTPKIKEEEDSSSSEKELENPPEDDNDDDFQADENTAEVESEEEAEEAPKKPKLLIPSTPSLFVSSSKETKKCLTCHLRFDSEQELSAHQKLHGSFPCSFSSCDFTSTYAPKLAEHELTHSTPIKNEPNSAPKSKKKGKGCKALKCPRCPSLTLSRTSNYINHFLETHLCLTSFKEITLCPVCHLSFFDIHHRNGRKCRRRHVEEQHNIKGMDEASIVRCDKCPAYFRRHMHLFSHNKKMHGGDALQCKDCGSKLANSYAFRNHRIEVHKLNPADFQFVCDIPSCSERFETERERECHKSARHNKNAKEDSDTMICTECGKTFAGPLGLKGHMRTHEKGFQQKVEENRKKMKEICDQCGKSFRDKHRMETHKQVVHLGPQHWKFECEVCGKKCFNKNKLEEHARVHLKAKSFICDLCGASYAHAHNLRLHKKNKHGKEVKKVFKKRSLLMMMMI
ncbi:Gastrula zinc finger protein XlCGF48.2 [Orchesella cincta]|uniref:Gastrula zinc finger protein XlCGF48.2 n=1 Tax=Orchesella cincta TaxID=48709 RepID=A0A1D2MKC9_ORCCI|nr:Gastrula zinc finger protein XlCGF48.2 [Orchesella cincta]